MDNMTALVSCFARAYHYRNSNLPVFADHIADANGRGVRRNLAEHETGHSIFRAGFPWDTGRSPLIHRQLSACTFCSGQKRLL